MLLAIFLASVVLVGGGWKVYIEYSFHPSLSFEAFVSPTYKKDYVVGGMKWPFDNLQNITIAVGSASEYPIHNLELIIEALDGSEDEFFGVAQLSNIPGVEFNAPDFPDLRTAMNGKDGKRYDLSMKDMFAQSGIHPRGSNWNVVCPFLPKAVQLRLALAAIHLPDNEAPKKLKLHGSYDVLTEDGNKYVQFERVVAVTR